jgi:hypothetical protein
MKKLVIHGKEIDWGGEEVGLYSKMIDNKPVSYSKMNLDIFEKLANGMTKEECISSARYVSMLAREQAALEYEFVGSKRCKAAILSSWQLMEQVVDALEPKKSDFYIC